MRPGQRRETRPGPIPAATAYPRRVRHAETLEIAGVRWWLRAGVDPGRAALLLERALAQLARSENLRSGRRKRLFRIALETEAPDHLLKRSGYPPTRGWLRRPGGSKACRELVIAQTLAARAVPVVVPFAAGERRRAGRLVECFLLAPLLEDAVDLRRLWSDPGLAVRERRRLAASLGEIVRRAHAAGLYQDDLAPNNVLVSGGGTGALCLVDFERARLRRRVGTRARRRMLAKLARAAGAVPAAQRLRFLCAYAGDAEQARRWWQRLCAEAPRLARRDDMRMRRTATRAGRRFREIEHGVWRGFARQAVDPALALGRASLGPLPAAGAARVEADGGVWRVVYRRLSGPCSRRLWARANTLAARGLAPVPLALLSDHRLTLLVIEPGAGAQALGALACGVAERRAAARLLIELEAIGELRGELALEDFAVLRAGGGRLRAQLVAPHAFRFGGRSGGSRSRAVAARLLACLTLPPAAV